MKPTILGELRQVNKDKCALRETLMDVCSLIVRRCQQCLEAKGEQLEHLR